MMRERQRFLLAADEQDDAALASTDLGLIWTSITNAVPLAMLTVLYIIADPILLHRVRASLRDEGAIIPSSTGGKEEVTIGVAKVLANPLLQAVYAETLRLYVQAYVTQCSAHQGVTVGRWWLDQNGVVMVSSYANHMNKQLWNEGSDGAHPVQTFWADRFLRYPQDPLSGPHRRSTPSCSSNTEVPPARIDKASTRRPLFSLAGLEGMWIPYGGTSACSNLLAYY
ncbi:uncharacterized protein BO97DRAFT_421927 [Aspergillus homomorphus CBS 101889]|uniref:Cytochrome P450 n=1 Tax=Aspergillus homomorphus (strain CBS 101889) TaxID=1450537 RepID=A0A395I5T4_ASPHC|nr:hypothetical protein BO97DRAFT_421927 [Aspergillus homomorphus CBS 101889]RAL15136.1 hypothetical protein BO97DRAFT_421927 [Aspergillus homomorphus CBS 101889]